MKALLIIDVQNDFLPGGALPVPHGDEVISIINDLLDQFDIIIACKDWHPKDHISFAKWPPHCIQKTLGAEFPQELHTDRIETVFKKGQTKEGYSAFEESELASYLKERGVNELYLVGLAREFCVEQTAQDGKKLGFSVHIIEEGCKRIHE